MGLSSSAPEPAPDAPDAPDAPIVDLRTVSLSEANALGARIRDEKHLRVKHLWDEAQQRDAVAIAKWYEDICVALDAEIDTLKLGLIRGDSEMPDGCAIVFVHVRDPPASIQKPDHLRVDAHLRESHKMQVNSLRVFSCSFNFWGDDQVKMAVCVRDV